MGARQRYYQDWTRGGRRIGHGYDSFFFFFFFTVAFAFLHISSRTRVTSVLLHFLLVLFILISRISSTSRFPGKFPTVFCHVGSTITDFTML